MRSRHVWTGILLVAWTAAVSSSQDLPRGTIIDAVTCAADPSQSYALYLPSTYSPGRAWSVLMGFHPGGRGRAIVEAYQAAAEQHGYIVAGSNNSRNGPWSVSIAAVRAMSGGLAHRFSINAERVYLTGHSGGSRLALQVALDSPNIAGVIASSAGYADSRPRTSVPFAVFATTGTEDFNYIEMRMLDRKLKSPHHLERQTWNTPNDVLKRSAGCAIGCLDGPEPRTRTQHRRSAAVRGACCVPSRLAPPSASAMWTTTSCSRSTGKPLRPRLRPRNSEIQR